MNAKYNVPATAATSRGQLGANIAMQLWSFVDVRTTYSIFTIVDLTSLQAASKTTSTNTQWEITPKGIGFDKMILVALYHVGDDVWQADIAVDF